MVRFYKVLLFAVSLALLPALSTGQTSPDVEEIRNSDEFLWGTGTAKTTRKADNRALSDLISQISVEVESYFKNIKTEEDGNLEEYTKSVVKTYSNTSLQNARRKMLPCENGKKKVLRYIRKKDMKRIFKSRREKLLGYWEMGNTAEKEIRIGDALKNYYWSLVLLRSHPGVDTISVKIAEYEKEMNLKQILYEKLGQIFSSLDFEVKRIIHNEQERKKTIELAVLYQDKKVENLDYEYYTGDGYSNVIKVKNGKGVLKLFDASAKALNKVDLYVQYKYENKAQYDAELQRVLENTSLPSFSRSKVTLDVRKEPEKTVTGKKAQYGNSLTFNESLTLEKPDTYIQRTLKVVGGIRNRTDPAKLKKAFTAEGFGMYKKLIDQGNVTVLLDDTASLNVVEVNNEISVRAVPMSFSYKNNNRDFVEDVIFTYNREGKIDALSFSLSKIVIDDIAGKSDSWASQEEKYLLIHFMEYYKTAYCLKRLDYIENIFDDNALIIVGHVLKKDENKSMDRMYSDLDEERVEYIKLSKQEYISRLERVFSSNEFINIDFEDNEVTRLNDERIYGIQINQHYHSTNYADQGYLFLMMDLKDTANPRIYVRSWQPKKFDDGSIIGLKDFHF